MSYRTIPEMFYHVCRQFPDAPAFMHKVNGTYVPVTHSELIEMVECFALGLLSLGIRAKDRIGIVAENRLEWPIVDFGIVSIGAVDVPIFPTLSAKQEEYIFSDCQVSAIVVSNKFQLSKVMEFKNSLESLRHIIVMNNDFETDDIAVKSLSKIIQSGKEIRDSSEHKDRIVEIAHKVEEDDLLTLIYTSGTTGNPKGVMLTHKNVVSNFIDARAIIHFNETDRFLTFLPWCHSYERTTGYYAAFSAASVICFAEAIETVGANIKETNPTFLTTVPRLMEMIMKKIFANMDKESGAKKKIFNWACSVGRDYVLRKQEGEDPFFLKAKFSLADKLVFSKIREKIGLQKVTFVSGGAGLPAEVNIFFQYLGYIVVEGYGLTEASPIIAGNTWDINEIGTVGIPLPNVEVKLAEDGEILARGPNIMKGYWGDPVATNEAIDEDGWLYTGDVGIITKRGNIKITDRKKNIFVSSGGKNIAPQPIEDLLSQSPYVEQCILIGENREFLTALITPDFDQIKKLAENFGIKYQNETELIFNEHIIKAVKNDIDRLQKDLSKYEKVRKFSLLSKAFSVENGELTPKLSIKRHVVERKYNDLIESMYDVK